MLHNNLPSADAALLPFLAAAVMLMFAFAAGLYWLAQPTVLPNVGLAGYEMPKKPKDLFARPVSHENETAAITFAKDENARQGFQTTASLQAPRGPEPSAGREAPKPKRVVRAPPKRDSVETYARAAPRAGHFDVFGAFFR